MNTARSSASSRTAITQIRGQRLADIARQRQPLNPRSLATHQQLPGAPVDVLQPQAERPRPAHPQPHQQQQDREITAAVGRPAVAARDSSSHLIGVEPARQPLKPPERHRRHHLRQRPVDQPLDSARTPAATAAPSPSASPDRRGRRWQSASTNPSTSAASARRARARRPPLTREATNGRTQIDIAARGARRHTPLDQQILAIALEQQLDLRERRPSAAGTDAKPAQIGQQRHQPLRDA